VTGGGTPSTSNASYYDGGSIPWVTPIDMRNIDGFTLPRPRRFITEEGLQNSSAKIIKSGSIVMSSRAPIGYIGICDKFIATSQGCKRLTLNEGSEWSSKFVVIAIKAQLNQIIENASGTTFKEISGTEFSHIQIPWPSSENERKETVSRVEELFLSIS
jgi:type I restriction enzyme S subunit